MQDNPKETKSQLLEALRELVAPGDQGILTQAEEDTQALLAVANALMERGSKELALKLMKAEAAEPAKEDPEQQQARFHLLIQIGEILLDDMEYAEAEDVFWKAKKSYQSELNGEFTREDVSLLITQCRFGQGFVQDAIDRGEEILRKLLSIQASPDRLAKTYQQLGWYYLHRNDIPLALEYMKKGMERARKLDQKLVNDGMAAERAGNFQQAIEHYFDSIVYDS